MLRRPLKLPATKFLRVANVEHRLEDDVPGVGILQSGVGEHATIPADVLDSATFKIL